MGKRALSVLLILCVFGITCVFASETQKYDSSRLSELNKVVPNKTGSDIKLKKTVPFNNDRIDPKAAKIVHAVPPKVTYPSTSHQLGYNGSKFSITVKFNTDIDRSTVIACGTVVLDFPKAANAPGQIIWISDREFKWEQLSEQRFNICIYDPDCEFRLTLTDGIRSKEGLKLDGDNDNKQGGNFSIMLVDFG